LGAPAHRASAPAASGIPHIAITTDKVENNTPKKEGVKGIFPLGCLPLWGREGVTIINTEEIKTISGYNRSSTEPKKEKIKEKMFSKATGQVVVRVFFVPAQNPVCSNMIW
jgi:hypothetical protein